MADANRNLLFGLLALQNGLVNQAQLVAAFQAWTLDMARPLAEQLVGRGDLHADDRSAVEALVARHLLRFGDVEKSLAAVPVGKSTRDSLSRLAGPKIEATLSQIGSAHGSTDNGDSERTPSISVGAATSDGQRFRILRPHAQGGLGAIFVAQDSELDREVALKQILDHHADNPDNRQRFLVEARITGGLEHPGIVPVYGLGAYPDGRPYYAMRFIRGDSLKEAIAHFHAEQTMKADPGRRSLELRKLLRRFIDVCNAIDYAHSRGVLHRDIKPGNVIIGKHGETLVVDWGLAKPVGRVETGGQRDERTLKPTSGSGSAETLPGSALGTPGYMSPEQAAGDLERLSRRSDVYGLGATLYCLLTGRPPVEGDDVGEVLRKGQRGELAASRELDPALEAVCRKAMATNPDARYVTCRALADDVERWMADEAVSAWAEPRTRKLLRWLTRHRTGVTGAAAAGLAGVVGLLAVLAVQSQANASLAASLARETAANVALAASNNELARSKDAVQARYDLAVDAIKTFHTGVSEDFLLKEEKFKDLRDRLLKSASDFYGKLASLLGNESDVASRRALLSANFEVADLTGKVGRYEDALSAHRQVLAAREALAADAPADTDLLIDVGRSLTAVGAVLQQTGKTDLAVAAYRKAESLLAVAGGPGPAPDGRQTRSALAACRNRLAGLLHATGHADDALSVYRLARADQEAMVQIAGELSADRPNLARTIHGISIILSSMTGMISEAEADCRAALALYQKLADENSAVADFRSQLASSRNFLGSLLSRTGRLKEAEAEYVRALALYQKLANDHSAVTEFRTGLAGSHTNFGLILSVTHRPSEAEAEYRKALTLYQKLDDNPAATDFRNRVANIHNSLGNLLNGTGNPLAAETEYRMAMEIYQKLADDSPTVTDFRSSLAIGHNNLGVLLATTGKPSEAEQEYRKAMAVYRKLADDNFAVTDFRNRLANTHNNLGLLLSGIGRPSDAEDQYRKALALHQKLADDNPAVTDFRSQLASSNNYLGILLSGTGRPSQAEAHYRQAVALYQKLADDNLAVTQFQAGLAGGHMNLGVLLSSTDRPSEAETEYRKALALFQKLADAEPGNPGWRRAVAMSLNNLADLDNDAGRFDAAIARLKESCAIHERLAHDHPTLSDYRSGLAFALTGLGRAHHRAGRSAQAVDPLRRAIALRDAIPNLNFDARYDLARDHGLLASIATDHRSGPSAGFAASEADRAMAVLRIAVAAGYRDAAGLRTDPDLAPLRDRPDFRLLLLDLSFPAEPFARVR
jgi:eukaryotic-like serine/threonine-protein kinase